MEDSADIGGVNKDNQDIQRKESTEEGSQTKGTKVHSSDSEESTASSIIPKKSRSSKKWKRLTRQIATKVFDKRNLSKKRGDEDAMEIDLEVAGEKAKNAITIINIVNTEATGDA